MAEVRTLTTPLGWLNHCEDHGHFGIYWGSRVLAAYDVLGHLAHFHAVTAPAVS